jgi:Asp-tRNA(Asn)/Glu-tRNA(Gln) amidotransferase A subunit family amidase
VTDLLDHPVPELVTLLRDRRLSAVELTTACLERIGALDDQLHAWAHLDPEVALAQAREREAATPAGPLHGIPVGVKDIIDTADQPTEHGSPIYAGNRPERDATAVARLRGAGAVIIGKTVTTEFALFQPPPTVNPHDPERTPGGSSSGSAAAVAAGMVPLAIGTQTAGSVVRPASFCGIVGAKPTIRAIPTDGVKPCSGTLDTVGAFSRDVEGAALALGVMAGDVERFRPTRLGDRPRIGFARTAEWSLMEPGAQAVVEAAVQGLAQEADVIEVELPPSFAGLVAAQLTVMGTEALRELAWEREQHPDQLSDRLRTYLADSASLVDGYEEAMAERERCRGRLEAVFADIDVLLVPSVLGEAPPRETTGDPVMCRGWTLLGTPTVAVPGLTGPAGLPLGIQVVGPSGRDDLALGGARRVAELLRSR